MESQKKQIKYPYIPEGKTILYVKKGNPFIEAAKKFAREHSLDSTIQTGSVVVMNNIMIGLGANGSDYHKTNECERIKRGIPTGQGYELCEGCHPKNHSERKAIEDAIRSGHDTVNADLYLWGHWWCCESCWDAIVEAGVKNVYLLEDSEILFNREDSGNIIGTRFNK